MPLQTIKFFSGFLVLVVLSGCGVKGDPLPPLKAPRLGRGHPTYTKASQYVTPDYEKEDEKKESEDAE